MFWTGSCCIALLSSLYRWQWQASLGSQVEFILLRMTFSLVCLNACTSPALHQLISESPAQRIDERMTYALLCYLNNKMIDAAQEPKLQSRAQLMDCSYMLVWLSLVPLQASSSCCWEASVQYVSNCIELSTHWIQKTTLVLSTNILQAGEPFSLKLTLVLLKVQRAKIVNLQRKESDQGKQLKSKSMLDSNVLLCSLTPCQRICKHGTHCLEVKIVDYSVISLCLPSLQAQLEGIPKKSSIYSGKNEAKLRICRHESFLNADTARKLHMPLDSQQEQ